MSDLENPAADRPNDEVSVKKVSLKQRFSAARETKEAAIRDDEIAGAPVVARSTARMRPGRLGFGNVIVADSDPRDHLLEFDRDASDAIHVTDMDPNDPIGYPSDIIPSNPF